jgi:hypothetical protein
MMVNGEGTAAYQVGARDETSSAPDGDVDGDDDGDVDGDVTMVDVEETAAYRVVGIECVIEAFEALHIDVGSTALLL